jgi:hypothetical protein
VHTHCILHCYRKLHTPEVAVKVMLPSPTTPLWVLKEQFKKELVALAAAENCPTAVRCFGWWIDGESHYIVMEVLH